MEKGELAMSGDMPKILYHVTSVENVKSILENGLKCCHGGHSGAFVSLSERPDSRMKEGLALLEVDVEGLPHKMTSWVPEGLDEVCYWGDIPPSRIKLRETT